MAVPPLHRIHSRPDLVDRRGSSGHVAFTLSSRCRLGVAAGAGCTDFDQGHENRRGACAGTEGRTGSHGAPLRRVRESARRSTSPEFAQRRFRNRAPTAAIANDSSGARPAPMLGGTKTCRQHASRPAMPVVVGRTTCPLWGASAGSALRFGARVLCGLQHAPTRRREATGFGPFAGGARPAVVHRVFQFGCTHLRDRSASDGASFRW